MIPPTIPPGLQMILDHVAPTIPPVTNSVEVSLLKAESRRLKDEIKDKDDWIAELETMWAGR